MAFFGPFQLNFVYFWCLKASMKFFSTQLVRKYSPKCLETINILRFQKYFKLRIKWLFLYNNFVVTCFKIGFTISVLKICELYLYSKLSQDSRNSGEFLWYIIFRQSFFKLGQTSKKRQILPKLATIRQWECELRANNVILLAEKRQWGNALWIHSFKTLLEIRYIF